MTNITIISGIIAAVCVFQTVEAGILEFTNLDSPLENVIQKSQKQFLNSKECNDAWDEGKNVFTKFQLNLNPCLLKINNNNMVKPEIDKFMSAVNDLMPIGRKLLECITNFDILCILQNCIDMSPLFSEVVDAANNCIAVFPKVGTCTQNAIPPSDDWKKIVRLGEQCFKNVLNNSIF